MRILALFAIASVACGSVSQRDDDDAAVGGDASVDAPLDAPIDGVAASHIVFTSSSVTTGGLPNGRDDMSTECQRLATAAGLAGNFVALVHLRSTPIDNTYVTIDGPVANTNGEIVAADAAAFFAGTFLAGNNFNESGGIPGDTVAWVGDAATADTCGDWSSNNAQGGQADTTGTAWLSTISTAGCGLGRSIQCISQ